MGDYTELGKRTARAIPGSKLVELEGLGHMPQAEDFDAYFTPLLDFLEAPAPDTAAGPGYRAKPDL